MTNIKQIAWDGFDGDGFQRFCNALLYSQVSKKAQLYSAAGRDGGIDQLFHGDWEGYSGKWRFQDKFKSTARATAVSSLRQDIPNDIRDHAADENIIVYLTNVSLLPDDEEELKQLAAEAFTNKGITTQPVVLFWHHAIIEAKVDTDPVLYNGFFATHDPLLEDYREHFAPQLQSTGLRSQLRNRFIGRLKHLNAIRGFLDTPDSTLVITGPGNYGKTRLALHFFQNIVDQDDKWLALVLKPKGFSAASFGRLLAGNRHLLILLDDAHRHLDVLAALKAEIEKTKGRVKLVMTVRKSALPVVKSSLPTHSRNLLEIALDPLPEIEAKELVRGLLPLQTENNLQWLRDKSGGVPGVLIALCDRIIHLDHPLDTASDPQFGDYVTEILQEAIEFTAKSTSQPSIRIQDFIRLLALLGPVPTTAIPSLANMLACEVDDLQHISAALGRFDGLIGTKPSFAIKPDPVSDTILRNILLDCPAWIEKMVYHPQAAAYLENIAHNLADLELPSAQETLFIRNLLSSYIDRITDRSSTEEAIRKIFHTAIILTLRMPELAVKAIQLFTGIYTDSDHPLHRLQRFSRETPMQVLRKDAVALLGRLIRETVDIPTLEGYFDLFEDCVWKFDDVTLVYSCFGFTTYELETAPIHSGPCCHRQLYLATKIAAYNTADDPIKVRLALETFKCLNPQEFTFQDPYDPHTGQFFHGQMYLPNCTHVRELRTCILEGLIAYHQKYRSTQTAESPWLAEIANPFRFIFVGFHKNQVIDQTNEVERSAGYFANLLRDNPTVSEKAVLLDTLTLGNGKPVKPEFDPTYRSLLLLLEPDSPAQRLELFLDTRGPWGVDGQSRITEIIDSFPSFQDFLTTFRELMLTKAPNRNISPVIDLAHYIGKHHLQEARNLLDFAIEKAPAYIRGLSTISDYFLEDVEGFFAVIDKIWNLSDFPDHRTLAIGMLLTFRRVSESRLHKNDLNYLAWAVDQEGSTSTFAMDRNLYLYADIDPDGTFALLHQLAIKNHHAAVDDIIYSISDDKDFCSRHKARIMTLFADLTVTVHALSMDFQPALAFVREQYGDEPLFQFLTNTLRVKTESGRYIYQKGWFGDDGDFRKRCQFHIRFLNWLQCYPHNLDESVRTDLLEFFLPRHPRDEEENLVFINLYGNLIDGTTDQRFFEDLATCFQGYKPYTKLVLSLQSRLSGRYLGLAPGTDKVEQLLGSQFMHNNETGKQASAPNQPYIEDLRKQKLLKEFLTEETLSAPVQAAIVRALATVEAAIAQPVHGPQWSTETTVG